MSLVSRLNHRPAPQERGGTEQTGGDASLMPIVRAIILNGE